MLALEARCQEAENAYHVACDAVAAAERELKEATDDLVRLCRTALHEQPDDEAVALETDR
jgi:hypothetical protein